MRRFGFFLLMLAATAPAWAVKKVTVHELEQALVSMQQAKKADISIAERLAGFELTEELTPETFSRLTQFAAGPLSTEQMNILMGRSAFLSPPAAELPAGAAPDQAEQKAIMAKAVKYVSGAFMHTPQVTAAKTTSRYLDHHPTRTLWTVLPGSMNLSASHTETVKIDHYIERVPANQQLDPWKANMEIGQISESGPGPVLSVVFEEAAEAGKLGWERWETINGKRTAVFSFAVDRQKSTYQVDYCCFPAIDYLDQDDVKYVADGSSGFEKWVPFKAVVGYHGLLFVDPETGTIVRLVTHADMKPTDSVQQEDVRVDYKPITLSGVNYVLPERSFTFAMVIPAPDAIAKYPMRHTLFTATYENYKLAEETAAR